MKNRKKMVLLFGIVFSIMGTIAFVLGPKEWSRIARLKKHGVETPAVLATYEKSGPLGKIQYTPVFRYTASDGVERMFRSDVSASYKPYAPGAVVKILVDPANPANAVLLDGRSNLARDFSIITCMLFGLAGYSNLFWLLFAWVKQIR